MIAKRIMTPFEDLITAGADETLYSAIYKMNKNDIKSIIIMDDKFNPHGILTTQDILRALVELAADCLTLHIQDYMTTNLIMVDETTTLHKCREKMIKHKINHLIIVDHNGEVTGILSSRDIVCYRTTTTKPTT